jgi:hypothetical protein
MLLSVTDLSEDEVRKLLQLQSIAKPEVKKYETRKRALDETVKHIQETVSTTYITRTYKCNGPYEILVSLQKRLKPKKDERQREIINTINKLNDNPKRTRIDAWLHEYGNAYTAATEKFQDSMLGLRLRDSYKRQESSIGQS